MGWTNEQVFSSFLCGSEKDRRSRSLLYEDGVLYSYGHHFPLAVRAMNGVVVNSDLCSVTTTRHRSQLLSKIKISSEGDVINANTQNLKNLIHDIHNFGGRASWVVAFNSMERVTLNGKDLTTTGLIDLLKARCKSWMHPAVLSWLKSLEEAEARDLVFHSL